MVFEKVREARLKASLPQMRLAQVAGRSMNWYRQVEAGCTRPSRRDAEKIAQLLGQPADELFSRIREDMA